LFCQQTKKDGEASYLLGFSQPEMFDFGVVYILIICHEKRRIIGILTGAQEG
jgi:hypothetical protein